MKSRPLLIVFLSTAMTTWVAGATTIDVVAFPCDSRTANKAQSKGYQKGDEFEICVKPAAEYESDYVIVGFDSVTCRNKGESKTIVSRGKRIDKDTTIIDDVEGNENIVAIKTVASPEFFSSGDLSLGCTGEVILESVEAPESMSIEAGEDVISQPDKSCRRRLRAKFKNDSSESSWDSSRPEASEKSSFATKIRLLPESSKENEESQTEQAEDDVDIDVVAYPCDSRTGIRVESKGYEKGDDFDVCVAPTAEYESDYVIVGFDSVSCRNRGESKTLVSQSRRVDKNTTIIEYVDGNENIMAFKTVASPEFFKRGDSSLGCTGAVVLATLRAEMDIGEQRGFFLNKFKQPSCRHLRATFRNAPLVGSGGSSYLRNSFATKIRLLPESTQAPSTETSIQISKAPTELVEDDVEIDVVSYPCDSRTGNQTQSKGYRMGDNFEVCVAPTAEYESDYVIVGFDSVTCRNKGESKTIVSRGKRIDKDTTIIDDVEGNENIVTFKTVASPEFFSSGDLSLGCTGEVILASVDTTYPNGQGLSCRRRLRAKFKNDSSEDSESISGPGSPKKSSFATKIRLLPESTPAPSAQITIKPTEAPTGLAEDRPEQRPCAKDVKLTRTDGVTAFGGIADAAVSIVSQDRSTVTVALKQTWNTPYIEKYFYHYKEDTFSSQCHESIDVETGAIIDTITIKCNVIAPIALLNICLQDNTGSFLDSGDNGEVGKCCHSDAPEGTPTVCYNLAINCQTECEEGDERIRHLRSQSV